MGVDEFLPPIVVGALDIEKNTWFSGIGTYDHYWGSYDLWPITPTHWQSLPSPPKVESVESG